LEATITAVMVLVAWDYTWHDHKQSTH